MTAGKSSPPPARGPGRHPVRPPMFRRVDGAALLSYL